MMRSICLMMAICSVFQSGCSILVLESGHSLGETETREQVRKRFGEPIVRGNTDEFTTHRKLSEFAASHRLGLAMTFGLYELYAFPESMIVAAANMIEGQSLKFVYDDKGNLRQIYLDGELQVDSSSNHLYRGTLG